MKWRRARQEPSAEAARALQSSTASQKQARADFTSTSATFEESRRVKARIASHNAANAYGQWMESCLHQARRARP